MKARICSPRTMYRILDAAQEIKERRHQVRRPHYGDGNTMRNDIKGINALGKPVQGLELWDKQ